MRIIFLKTPKSGFHRGPNGSFVGGRSALMFAAPEGEPMILAALFATSMAVAPLIVPVAIERGGPMMLEPGSNLSVDQKSAAVQPLVSSATECIARTVSADPRFSVRSGAKEFNNLIVESVPSCVDALRSMIDTYDRLYGDGAGETFFVGPYLDGLPDAVTRRVKSTH